MFGSPLCAVGTKLFFVCFLRCMIFCLHVTRVVSRLNHPAGSIFCAFCCCGSVFFFRIEFTSLFRCSRFPCLFARQLQRWCFSGLIVTPDGSRHCRYVHLRVLRFAPRVALACSVSFPSPCLFLLHRLRWLLLGQGWCSLGRP